MDKIREIWYMTTVINCKVSRTNPPPTFRWQHQSGLCLNDNRECKPSDSKWQDVSAPFSVSPAVDVATGVSKLTFPQNLQSAFFRCVATNEMESDDYVMRFLGGRLIYFFHLNILDWLAWEYSRLSSLLAPNVPSGDEWREQLYSPAAARQVLQICLFVCLFNFVNPVLLSGFLLFFCCCCCCCWYCPLLSFYSIYFAMFSLESLKAS